MTEDQAIERIEAAIARSDAETPMFAARAALDEIKAITAQEAIKIEPRSHSRETAIAQVNLS